MHGSVPVEQSYESDVLRGFLLARYRYALLLPPLVQSNGTWVTATGAPQDGDVASHHDAHLGGFHGARVLVHRQGRELPLTRNRLKFAVWLLTTALTLLFS